MRLFRDKKSANYYVDLREYGAGRRSTGTPDFEEARFIAGEIEQRMRRAKFGISPPETDGPHVERIPLSEFHEKYVQFMAVTFPETPKTAEGARSAFRSLETFFGKKDPVIDDISKRDVEKWKVFILEPQGEKKGRSRNTLAIYFRALHAAWNRAVSWGNSSANPFSDVERPQEAEAEDVEYFDDPQLVKLLEKAPADQELVDQAMFYLYTGMRRNEGIYCEWTDVDLNGQTIRIPGRKSKYNHRTKSGRPRAVPISEPLLDLLVARFNNRKASKALQASDLIFPAHDKYGKPKPSPWWKDTVTRRFARWVKDAGLPKSLTVHSLRHTFASNLVQRGVSLYIVGELLGHSDLEVTKIYSHLTPQSYNWVVDLLDFSQESVLDRIERGKVARVEAFDRTKLMAELDKLTKEVEMLRSENAELKEK